MSNFISSLFLILKKKSYLILLLVLSMPIIGACNIINREESNVASKPFVLTTFTVLADMARNVAGNRLTVKSVTKPGAEIHGYQFTPSDIIRAKGASIIIENGLGLESWISRFTISAGNVPRFVLSEGMEPLLIEGDVYAGKPNPHAWMSPKRAISYVDRLVEAFVKIDPSGKSYYLKNAKNYKEKLEALDKELSDSLALVPLNKRVLVSCEGAFTYLAHDYGMDEEYLWPVNSESQVTPRRMTNLISKIKEKSVPTIFCESTVSSKAQKEVAKASGAKFGGIFYVDSLSDSNGPAPTLLEMQRHNVRLIIKGLSQ